MIKCALLRITGTVQGVFFRATCKEQADKFNVQGYAKNMPDGSVEVLAQGEEEDVNALIDWCKQGPPSAKVDNVEISYQELKEPMRAEGSPSDAQSSFSSY